ncbi:dynamin family protein [Bacillus solitudinis]|uniref:dynamin family protein n=1 Tax=Bacillus solitudinis TaxID=2014074 RepID=UPI000C243944|nr:dynamin family protein [Bacillus solitudinis]
MSTLVDEVVEKGIGTLTESEQSRLSVVKEKQQEQVFQVAFCGHFSAGKSTILNRLLGAEVLPTSPIPTSANIIGIKNGELGLSVVSQDGDTNEWTGEIPWERVREWGMNGTDISDMTIYAPLPFLGEQSVIYDTPGVDSTDPTHQAVTLEALYGTDLIVYVMDYNHVQSETNLHFLKQLSDEKKPLYIVINQIDKHDESELSFEAFDESVRQGLSRWGIDVMKLYYTSMKSKSHQLNKFSVFEKEMKAIFFHGAQLSPFSKQRLQQSFYLSVIARLEEEKDEEIETIVEKLQKSGFDQAQLEKRTIVQEAYQKNKQAKYHLEATFQKEWNNIVQNVTIFPYTTTELVRNWLESVQPGFKVGLLFTKKKTEEEQARRLEKLVKETEDKVKSQLAFHFQRTFQKVDREHLTNSMEVDEAIAQVEVNITEKFFKEAVVSGHMSRDYVFTFTKDRTAEIVKQLKQKATSALEVISRGMETHWSVEQDRLQKQLEELQQISEFVEEIEKVNVNYNEAIHDYENLAERFKDQGAFERKLSETSKKTYPTTEQQNQLLKVQLPQESVIDTNWELKEEVRSSNYDEKTADEWLEKCDEILQTYQHEPWLHLERQQFMKRVQRNKEQSFMISLFGAFSAGKSSFANALLGEAVLPVSPHPTTATVNTVKKSELKHAHNTAIVEVKTREMLINEIRSVAKQLDVDVTFETLPRWKPTMKQYVSSWQKTYAEYLLTLKDSLSNTTWDLGAKREINREELTELVANESYACLINHITLYYDCPLTKQGIVLVDTPGVNSIHGRHTNVAFKQLRESDAIFYVTYYNHAFSRADQHFLQQMARVNEGYRHDKLYFILNAADLAGSEQELNGVRKHIYDQLLTNGIEQPRIYHLSSKQGLLEKQTGKRQTNWFSSFEQAFYERTIHELKQLSFDLLKQESKRYISKLAEAIQFISSEESEKEEKRQQLKELVIKWSDFINESESKSIRNHSVQEVSQLFLYLRERIRFVLNDGFIDAINVTTIKGASKKAQQQSLGAAIKEWRAEGEHFLEQELHATIIRVEQAIKDATEMWIHEMERSVQRDLPAYSANFEAETTTLEKPSFDRFIALNNQEYVGFFKSLKSFFEEGDVKRLKEALVEDATEQTRDVLLILEQQLKDHIYKVIENLEIRGKEQLIHLLQREIERFDAVDSKDQQQMEIEKKKIQQL